VAGGGTDRSARSLREGGAFRIVTTPRPRWPRPPRSVTATARRYKR